MARARDILYRFRPAGSPGAAGATGVPVDRGADLEAELGPLFGLLADTEAACDAIVERARSDADSRATRDDESAGAIVGSAEGDAAAERATAEASARRAGAAELNAIRAAAEHEAEEVRRRAAARMPGYVARVVELVRAVGEPSPPEGRGGA